MTTSATAPAVAARRPALDRATAARLAATEYDRMLETLRGLDRDDWSRPTANTGWDVRALAGHVLGMAEFAGSAVEQVRQLRAAKRRGGLFIDALTAVQVDRTASLSPAEVVASFERAGGRAARRRARTPRLLRGRTMAEQPVSPDQFEPWTMGYLVDVILTRDTWMHRSDVAAATGRPMQLTADHDGVLVADVAVEWAQRHGRPCTLTLTGPAGGRWTFGDARESLDIDAVEFCRTLSGRGAGEGLLATRVPF